MEKDSKTTVAVERTTFAKLDRLAKANSVSKMEYITHAINYFEKYGINNIMGSQLIKFDLQFFHVAGCIVTL